MKVAVYGAGAVGGYFGGKLATVPWVDVTFIARGETLRVLKQTGLKLATPEKDTVIDTFGATDSLEDLGDMDVVLVCTKAWQVPGVAEKIRDSKMIGKETVVVPMQNGMDSVGCLRDALGAEHVAGGLCRIFAFIDTPGCIRVPAKAASVDFGGLGSGSVASSHKHLRALYNAFKEAGVQVNLADDMWPEMWRKFITICVLSGVGAVSRVTWGEIVDSPRTWALCVQCVAEAVAIANAKGMSFDEEFLKSAVDYFKNMPSDLTASLTRDVMAGKPSELEAQLGAMVRHAEEAGVAAPVFTTIYAALLPQELRARASAT